MSSVVVKSVEQLKSMISAQDFIGKYVKLTNRSGKHIGLCPFHKEKTPSFTVTNDFYYCFGCHASGDIIKFVQEHHGVSFVDAINKIAEDIGVSISVKQVDPEKKEEMDRRFGLIFHVKDYYHQKLVKNQNSAAWDYVTKIRKLSIETISNFEIGYSPSIKNQLYKYLLDLHYLEKEIILSGIVRAYGTSYFDFFDGRIIIPIKDANGRTIGFGGRVFGNSDAAKYINSAESDLFKKREILFNFAKAKQYKMKDKNTQIIMVEGYMDVVVMHQFGFLGGIAPLGTGITEQQIKLALGIDKQILFCFNTDIAGQNASFKVAHMVAKMIDSTDIVPRFVDLGLFKDVDELLNKDSSNSASAFKEKIKSAFGLQDFIWSFLSAKYGSKDANEVAKLESELFKFAETIPNVFVRKNYIRFFKGKIFEFTRVGKKPVSSNSSISLDKSIPDEILDAEIGIISLIIAHPELKNNPDAGIDGMIDNFSNNGMELYRMVGESEYSEILKYINERGGDSYFKKAEKSISEIIMGIGWINPENQGSFFLLSLERLISRYILIRLKSGTGYDYEMLLNEVAMLEEKIKQIDESIDKISNY